MNEKESGKVENKKPLDTKVKTIYGNPFSTHIPADWNSAPQNYSDDEKTKVVDEKEKSA